MKTKKTLTKKVSETSATPAVNLTFLYKLTLVVLLGVLSYLVISKHRSLFIAGTVNNSLVSRYQVNKIMAERYGKEIFDEVANERLLAQEFKQQQITVTDQDVQAEVDKIIKEYGDEEKFKTALTQYGLTLDKAKESIKKNILFKKLVEKNSKIEIVDADIEKYFNDNKETYKDKKLEDVKSQISEMLYQQQLYQKSQELFSQIRQKAKVNSFM